MRSYIIYALSIACIFGRIQAQEPSPSSAVSNSWESTVGVIEQVWALAREAMQRNDVYAVNTHMEEIERLKQELNYPSLDDYSMTLVSKAEERLLKGDREAAAFYTRRAISLSPRSAPVLFGSIRVAQLSGVGQFRTQMKAAVLALFNDLDLILRLAKSAVYPPLWALTLALYVTLLLLLGHHMLSLYGGIAAYLPSALRGIFTPLLAVCLVVLPCFRGPLWTVWVWALVALVWLKVSRWIGFWGGVCIVLWGTLIPLRETMQMRLSEASTRALLRVSSGIYRLNDRSLLEAYVQSNPADAVGLYAYGQVLRREGDYEMARDAIARADKVWKGQNPYAKAELGLINYLSGGAKAALQAFEQAESMGLSDVPFQFNYSKVKFELMDTEGSRKLLNSVARRDPGLVNELKAQEDELGMNSRLAVAEQPLPWRAVARRVFQPIPGSQAGFDSLSRLLMPGTSPVIMSLLGAVLVLLFLVGGRKVRRRRRVPLYHSYREPRLLRLLAVVIPGAAWVWHGSPGWSVVLLAIAFAGLMPLIAWPGDAAALFAYAADLRPYYLSGLCLYVMGVWYVGYFVWPEEE